MERRKVALENLKKLKDVIVVDEQVMQTSIDTWKEVNNTMEQKDYLFGESVITIYRSPN